MGNLKKKFIDFKTVSPFFEWERDGIKPFTIRKVDTKDSRFKSLVRWAPGRAPGLPVYYIRITHATTGEYFYRKLKGVSPMPSANIDGSTVFFDWLIIYLGEQWSPTMKEE